ncbi:MAG TPA: DUF2497 domain-containing protein [Rhizomicrobium sp.]|nr:DUF2497 domain-containing protein [Rhizomicrobium sp.]
MEEILASIRKIISEDAPAEGASAEAAASPPSPALEPAHVEEEDLDVLELTEEIPEEKPIVHTAPPELADDVVFEPIEEPAMTHAHDEASDGIFSDKTRAAMDNTFAGIDDTQEDEAPVEHVPAPIPSVDGSSIAAAFEHAVRLSVEPVLRNWLGANSDAIMDHMKPLIREWMDENFPPLLENAVRSEVARAARSKR